MDSESTGAPGVDERRIVHYDRRIRKISFRYPERRTGYDRRNRSRFDKLLLNIGSRRRTVAILLVALMVFNVIDIWVTITVVGGGQASELNPFMAAILGDGVNTFIAWKLAIIGAVTVVVWTMKRYRGVIELLVLSFLLYFALVLYEAIGCIIFLPRT